MPSLADVTSSPNHGCGCSGTRLSLDPLFSRERAVQTSGPNCAARTLTRICGRIRNCLIVCHWVAFGEPDEAIHFYWRGRWIASLRAMTEHLNWQSPQDPLMHDSSSRADGARFLADLTHSVPYRAYKTGVHRPTFSEPHMRSLQWLALRVPDAGLTAKIDGIGNVLGTSEKPGPKLLAGSHLIVRTLRAGSMVRWASSMRSKPPASSIRIRRSTAPSTSQRGATRKATLGDSGQQVLCRRSHRGGDRRRARPHQRQDHAHALREAGLAGRPRALCEHGRHIGYLEAHIEQGETLETSGLTIGVVTSIVGIWQYRITFTGEQNHAGTTRMAVRRDAGLALAKFCVAINDRFPAHSSPRTVWTTGRITLDPGAPSIIPGGAEAPAPTCVR